MAGYGYPYGSHNPHDGFNPWKTERSHNFEQLCPPALDEIEGSRMIAGDPYRNPGAYVMKIETTVEHIHPSMFSEFYRQCSPPRYEHRPRYGVVNNKPQGSSIPSNDRPPVVDEFFTKIQNEVSQPSGFGAPRAPYQLRNPVSPGYYGTAGNRPSLVEEFPNKTQNEVRQPSGFGASRPPYQLRIPVSSRYYGSTGNAEDSDLEKERHKPITNTMKNEDDRGDLKADKIQKPPVTTEGVYGARPGYPTGPVPPVTTEGVPGARPGYPTGSVPPSHHKSSGREQTIQQPSAIMAGRQERRVPNMALSKPINDIDTAVEYLKKVVDPSSFNTIKDEVPDRGQISKPPVATEGGPAVRPGHPTNERTIQPLSPNMTGGRERRGHDVGLEPTNEKGEKMEFSKEAVKPSSGSTVPKKDPIPETIDSKEARRRYGNVNSSPELNSTAYTNTIDSREAARRYKGEFV